RGRGGPLLGAARRRGRLRGELLVPRRAARDGADPDADVRRAYARGPRLRRRAVRRGARLDGERGGRLEVEEDGEPLLAPVRPCGAEDVEAQSEALVPPEHRRRDDPGDARSAAAPRFEPAAAEKAEEERRTRRAVLGCDDDAIELDRPSVPAEREVVRLLERKPIGDHDPGGPGDAFGVERDDVDCDVVVVVPLETVRERVRAEPAGG